MEVNLLNQNNIVASANIPSLQANLTTPKSNLSIQSQDKDLSKAIEKIEHAVGSNNSQIKKEVVSDRSIFTLFKLNDGVMYTRIRNLDTGEIKYFPTIEDCDFFEMIDQANGNIVDLKS